MFFHPLTEELSAMCDVLTSYTLFLSDVTWNTQPQPTPSIYHPQTPLNCLHEGCQGKPMTHGNGYCHLHGDRRKCTIHSVPTMSNQMACVYNMAIKRNNAEATDAPTMHQLVQSTIALCLSVESHCFRQGKVQISLQMLVNNIFN